MKQAAVAVLTLLLLLTGTHHGQAQEVALGNSAFSSTSDQTSAGWYWPVPKAAKTYDGFGDLEGTTRTETFTLGESVAGVSTIKWQIAYTPASLPEEAWWLALDTHGDLRVLKLVRAGSILFEASVSSTPPVFLPSAPVVGQNWALLGHTMSIEEVVPSQSGYRLKVGALAAGASEPEYRFYHAGRGLVHIETRFEPGPSGSGWRLRTEASTPAGTTPTPVDPPLEPGTSLQSPGQ